MKVGRLPNPERELSDRDSEKCRPTLGTKMTVPSEAVSRLLTPNVASDKHTEHSTRAQGMPETALGPRKPVPFSCKVTASWSSDSDSGGGRQAKTIRSG